MSEQSFFKSSSSSMHLNVGSLTPSQLSKIFKIPVSYLELQDEEKNVHFAADNSNTFDPPLMADKVYDVTNISNDQVDRNIQTFINLMPPETDRKAVIRTITENSVVESLIGPAKTLSTLIPASSSIENLIVTAATASDYSLFSSSVDKFVKLNNPGSMKVSVTQVAQEMSNVIQKNKSDLDAINLKMGDISLHFKYILPAIWAKERGMVTGIADKMKAATDFCVKKSDDCVKRCEDLVLLIQELSRALVGAQTDVHSKDKELLQNLEKLAEHVEIVRKKHDRRKQELEEQQQKFETAYAEHQTQQERSGSMWKHFGAGLLNIFSFGTAKARQGMDTAYENSTRTKKDEKETLNELREKFNNVDNELMNLKIVSSKDNIEKEGIQGIIAAISKAITMVSDLDTTVQNMREYFQTVGILIQITFQDNANTFMEYAEKDEPTPLEKTHMMESVLRVYSICYVVQSYAKIYSIVASSEKVKLRLSRATKYLGLTEREAKLKLLELNSAEAEEENKEDTEAIVQIIKNELKKQTENLTPNIEGFITSCEQTAKSIKNK